MCRALSLSQAMPKFIKYSGVAIAAQVVLTIVFLFAGRESALLLIIYLYYPMIFMITKIGGFTGESTMMMPVFLGIPLGILVYGATIGFILEKFIARPAAKKKD